MLSAGERYLTHPLAMEIGDLIRLKRAELRISQRELARTLDVNPSAVAQWELNQTRPTNENMAILRRVLGIDQAQPLSPGAPFSGQIIEDADELALLAFWRSLNREERDFMVKRLGFGGDELRRTA